MKDEILEHLAIIQVRITAMEKTQKEIKQMLESTPLDPKALQPLFDVIDCKKLMDEGWNPDGECSVSVSVIMDLYMRYGQK